MDGITSVNTSGWAGNSSPASVSFTAEVTDSGDPLFGLKIGYDVVLSGFTDDGAGTITSVDLQEGSSVGVDSALAGEDSKNIDSAAKLGGAAFEFLTASLANVSVIADPNNVLNGGTVTADGLVGVTIRHAGDGNPGESGRVLVDGSSTVLGTWGPDALGFLEYVTWTTPNDVRIVVDTLEAALQGFRARFIASTGGSVADPYDGWASSFVGLGDSDPSLDFDKGGLPTGIEWVVGGDPTDRSDDLGLAPTFDNSDPDDFLFVFRRAAAAGADSNTVVSVEYGADLVTWRNNLDHGTADGVVMSVLEDGFGAGIDRVAVAIPRTLETHGTLFARLRVGVANPEAD